MTRNPYAHPQPAGEGPDAPERISGLAVGSLVFGLLCCIPGSGVIATILGGAGMIRIAQSEGRLSGRGVAFVGLLLGLFGTMAWLALGVGGMYTLGRFGEFGTMVQNLQSSSDVASVRAALTPPAATAVTDERAAEFAAELTALTGKYQRMPQGLAEWARDYRAVGPLISQAGSRSNGTKFLLPLPMHFEKGLALVEIHGDSSATGPGGAAVIENIAVQTLDGKKIWLVPLPAARPGGPAAPGSGG